MDGGTGEWMDGWTEGWTDKWMEGHRGTDRRFVVAQVNCGRKNRWNETGWGMGELRSFATRCRCLPPTSSQTIVSYLEDATTFTQINPPPRPETGGGGALRPQLFRNVAVSFLVSASLGGFQPPRSGSHSKPASHTYPPPPSPTHTLFKAFRRTRWQMFKTQKQNPSKD